MSAQLSADAIGLLEALAEPALVVRADAAIVHANRPMLAIAGRRLGGADLWDVAADDRIAMLSYIHRCLGSRQPLVGALMIGGQRLPCRGSRMTGEGPPLALIRLAHASEDRFAGLAAKVRQLSEELRERWKAKALLEETLRERELLLQELQHRVKNNMAMLAAMLDASEREAEHDEARTALKDVSLRFSAVNAVQQLLYNSDDLESIGSDALVSTLVRAATSMAPGEIVSDVAVDPVTLPVETAIPVALLLNELLTNAVKHGHGRAAPQTIRVELTQHDRELRIVVADNGPGFQPGEGRKRASGLGLVRGLLRQLEGSIQVEDQQGARCTVTIAHPLGRASRRAMPDGGPAMMPRPARERLR